MPAPFKVVVASTEAHMAHSPRYEAHLEATWRDLIASVDALCAELKVASAAARRKALAAVARTLREPPGLHRLPLVKAILAELQKAGRARGRR